VPVLVKPSKIPFRQQNVKHKLLRAQLRLNIATCLIVAFAFLHAPTLSAQTPNQQTFNGQPPNRQPLTRQVAPPPQRRPATQISTNRNGAERRFNRAPVKPHAATKELALIREIIEPEILMNIEPTQSKIIRTNFQRIRNHWQGDRRDLADVLVRASQRADRLPPLSRRGQRRRPEAKEEGAALPETPIANQRSVSQQPSVPDSDRRQSHRSWASP